MTVRGICALGLLALAAAGCRDGEAALAPFPGGAPSLDALGRGMVEAFVKGDTARLKGYTLSMEEYRDVAWPRLGTDTTTGFTFGWSWSDNQRRGTRAYRRYLDQMKGLSLRAAETRCTGTPRRFGGVTVIPDCKVVVMDLQGDRAEMRLFRSVVVAGGGYKIFRYDD